MGAGVMFAVGWPCARGRSARRQLALAGVIAGCRGSARYARMAAWLLRIMSSCRMAAVWI